MKEQKSKKNTLILLSLGHSVNDICWFLVPLLLPLIREELQFSYTDAGLILTFFSIFILIFSIISGHLADLYEERKILSFGFLFTVVTVSFLFFTKTYLQIIVIFTLMGIGVSVFHPVGIATLSKTWRKGISFGLFEATGCTGILVMTFIFTPLVYSLGWRLTALVLAFPNLLLGLIFLLSKKSLRYKNTETQLPASFNNNCSQSLKNIIKSKLLILFFVGRGLQILGTTAVISFIPLFGVDIRGLVPEKASFFPTFIWMGAVSGGFISGVLSDYFSPLKIILVLIIAVIPAIFIITLPFPLFVTVIFLILIGFSHIGLWPVQNMWLGKVTSEKIRGKIFGGMISLVGLAQILSPLLFGFIADKWGLVTSFRWTIIPILIAVFFLGVVAHEAET